MALIVNRFFHKNNTNEQKLLNSLVTESIQVQGREYFYMPRDSQTRDIILGEDAFSIFKLAIPLEMYMVDAQGFQGQKEMFTKFGLQINNSYRLVVSVDRWNEEIKTVFDNGTAGFTVNNYVRPHEGDLIYDPLTKFLMVIKFVDHDMEFYSLGKNYAYYLSCEAFMYQNEPIHTHVPDIDIFDTLSKDILNNQLILEGDLGSLLLEEYSTQSITDTIGMSSTSISGNAISGSFISGQVISVSVGYMLNEVTPPIIPSRDTEVDFITPSTTISTTVNNPFQF